MVRTIIEKMKKIMILPKYLMITRKIRRENCLVLVGTSTYNNLGDHLLSQNSIEFLKNHFKNKLVVEIPTQVFKRYELELSKLINSSVIVVVSGGGWMGNLWPEDEFIMQRILRSFSKHKIIILPQTIFYDEMIDNYEAVLCSANNVYDSCEDLTLFVRETNSFKIAQELLHIKQVYIAPDMGLYGKKNLGRKEYWRRALICLRKDREAGLNSEVEQQIREFLTHKNYDIGYFNTIEDHNVSNVFRKFYLAKLNMRLSKANIVFTDRLHGMILAVNCGCKCVAFDNKNHKVGGVYKNWLMTNRNVLLFDDDKQLEFTKVDELVTIETDTTEWSDMIDLEFEKMAKLMEGVIR